MLKLITVGKMKNRALAEICADFTDRLKRFGVEQLGQNPLRSDGSKRRNALDPCDEKRLQKLF